MQQVIFQDLGLIDYKEAWEYQEELFQEIIDLKSLNRKEGTNIATQSHLLFCEHPHVYTLGKSGNEKNLLVNEKYLKSSGATFYKNRRTRSGAQNQPQNGPKWSPNRGPKRPPAASGGAHMPFHGGAQN